MSDRIITANLQAALMKAYPLPEYATFFEVGDATGGRHSRWADAVSMACWPSRGLAIWGFELKASRSDWLREKKNPEKSCAIQKYCNRWMLITAPSVILPGELPDMWGHAELVGNRLLTRIAAPALVPEPLDASFVAALLRRCGQASEAQIAQRIEEATAAARATQQEQIDRAVARARDQNSRAVAGIDMFKEATGIDLIDWRSDGVGKDFAAYMAARKSLQYQQFSGTAKRMRDSATLIELAVAELQACGLIEEKDA